jgi:hypothetical protein
MHSGDGAVGGLAGPADGVAALAPTAASRARMHQPVGSLVIPARAPLRVVRRSSTVRLGL